MTQPSDQPPSPAADQASVEPDPKRVLYDLRPNYTRPILEVPPEASEDMRQHLEFLYGPEEAERWLPEVERIIKVHHAHKTARKAQADQARLRDGIFSQRDMVLITYGDMIQGGGGLPLQVLMRVADEHMAAPNTIHILPFFPYSSDRGFSVVDFHQVDRRLGDWSDIRALAGKYKLMFDGVLNHVSSQSQVFQDYLDGRPGAEDYFIAYDSPDELTDDQRSKIFRPRTSDILTRFETIGGPKHVWTTFSADQIDLNFRDPKVLLAATEALLLYVRMGADMLRLDAVTYVWAEPGTECVHLPQTHEIVKFMRTVMDLAAPGTALVTETNVPHEDNVAYFGNGEDEAHMVYNFALPPLVLHTFYTGCAVELSRWAAGVEPPSGHTHFFNILDTHDGVGLLGARGILTGEQIGGLVETAKSNGALISYKAVAGGQEPYEVNTTWWSALNPAGTGEDMDTQVRRFTASRAIALALKGVPGVYLHGALGTENDWATYEKTKHARDVNRASVNMAEIMALPTGPGTKLGLMRHYLMPLQRQRVAHRAFHPSGGQKMLEVDPRVFALLRTSPGGRETILVLINVSSQFVSVDLPAQEMGLPAEKWRGLLSGREYSVEGGKLRLELTPYKVAWLKAV